MRVGGGEGRRERENNSLVECVLPRVDSARQCMS